MCVVGVCVCVRCVCVCLTSVQVCPGRQEGHVESDVSHCGVGLEDGDHSDLHEDQKHRVLPGRERKW